LLEVELGHIKTELTANPDYLSTAGITYFVGKTADIGAKLLDYLKPYIHSSISDLQSTGLKQFFHIAVNTALSVVDVWSGTVSASSRILNYLYNVTPRESGYAVLGSFTAQIPSVPTGLKVTVASSSEIDLSWTASIGTVTGYKVYKYGTYLKSVTTTSASDTGLSPSTNYCYSVLAYNSAGESTQCSPQCAVTQAPQVSPPSTPSGFTVDASSSTQINLAWIASTGTVTGYKVYKDSMYLKSVTTTSTSDTGLNPATNYCYYVKAYNLAGESVQTSTQCATTPYLTNTYSMMGTIHSGSYSGPGLSGATVSIAGRTATSSSTGTFSITGIPAGTYAFSVSKSGYDTYTNPAYYVGSNQSGLNFYITITSSSLVCPGMTSTSSNGIQFYGPTTWSVSTTAANATETTTLTWEAYYQNINHLPTGSYSGSLRARLWAIPYSFSGGEVLNYNVGIFNPTFTGTGAYSSTQLYVGSYNTSPMTNTVTGQNPPAGTYCMVATIEEYSPGCGLYNPNVDPNWCYDQWVQFAGPITFSNAGNF
jgi:hypothetical protein